MSSNSSKASWIQSDGTDGEEEPRLSWSAHSIGVYISRKPPLLPTTLLDDTLENFARKKLAKYPESFNYVFGSAGTNSTCKANKRAFSRWAVVPRMLSNATNRDISTTVLRQRAPSPILLAPIGVQGLVHPEGELASSRAAAKIGIPFIMSSASSRSIEDVANAHEEGAKSAERPGGRRIYQLYWPKTGEVTISLLRRAKAAGYTALVVTLDTNLLGWRPLDLQTACMPFLHGLGTAIGTSDPVFMARHKLQPYHEKPRFPYIPEVFDNKFAEGDKDEQQKRMLCFEWLREINHGRFRTWEDLKQLVEMWQRIWKEGGGGHGGEVIIKGIQRVEDAEKALEVGLSGIIVSNHGGRQVDGAIASLDALANITQSETIRKAQKEGKFEVLFDSGIRSGVDVIKAILLGANSVLLGRPYIYGLALGGQAGVEEVIRNLLAEVDLSLGLMGYKALDEIRGLGIETLDAHSTNRCARGKILVRRDAKL